MLLACVEAYAKLNVPHHLIEYASEALQYNRTHSEILFYRAEALHREKWFVLLRQSVR